MTSTNNVVLDLVIAGRSNTTIGKVSPHCFLDQILLHSWLLRPRGACLEDDEV